MIDKYLRIGLAIISKRWNIIYVILFCPIFALRHSFLGSTQNFHCTKSCLDAGWEAECHKDFTWADVSPHLLLPSPSLSLPPFPAPSPSLPPSPSPELTGSACFLKAGMIFHTSFRLQHQSALQKRGWNIYQIMYSISLKKLHLS